MNNCHRNHIYPLTHYQEMQQKSLFEKLWSKTGDMIKDQLCPWMLNAKCKSSYWYTIWAIPVHCNFISRVCIFNNLVPSRWGAFLCPSGPIQMMDNLFFIVGSKFFCDRCSGYEMHYREALLCVLYREALLCVLLEQLLRSQFVGIPRHAQQKPTERAAT